MHGHRTYFDQKKPNHGSFSLTQESSFMKPDKGWQRRGQYDEEMNGHQMIVGSLGVSIFNRFASIKKRAAVGLGNVLVQCN